jgi:hypothetical protein
MKKFKLGILVLMGFVLGLGGNALGYTVQDLGDYYTTETGRYMFTMSGNVWNQVDDIETEINSWFTANSVSHETVDLVKYDKIDIPAGSTENGFIDATWDDDLMMGTWSTDEPIEFYAVKGGNNFTVWWLEYLRSSGNWTTEFLTAGNNNTPGISNLSAFNPGDPVPEPATVLLLGFGLVGLATVGRRRMKKQ